MNSRDNVTVPVKLKIPHPPKGLPPALDYVLSAGVLPDMLGYVACLAGFEKGWGIGTEGKKGMSLGRDGPLYPRFLPFSPCLPAPSQFCLARQAMGYVGMCRSTGYAFWPSGSETAYKNHPFIFFISSQKSLTLLRKLQCKTTLLPPSEFFSLYNWCQGQSCKLKQEHAQSLKNSAAHPHSKFQWVPSPLSPNPALLCRLEFKVRPWFGNLNREGERK